VRRRNQQAFGFERGAGRVAAAISRRPREFVGILVATAAVAAIFMNALFLQGGPHPAPIFATRSPMKQDRLVSLPRPRPAEAAAPLAGSRSQSQIIGDIQRELFRKGFYDGVADGIWGTKTDAAARDFVQAAGLKIAAEASEGLLRAIVASNAKPPSARSTSPEVARSDPIAELIAPPKQVLAIQRALVDFGYGQFSPTGVFDAQTQAAIEKFERDRRLPVAGQISERLLRELAAVTGRPLE